MEEAYHDSDNRIKLNDYLEVHHRCYRTDKKICEQENDEYVSLCNVCHKIVHETYRIPYYNELNELINNKIPCIRCGGRKYFIEYKYVENKVCFRCRGTGIEERD